MCKLLFALVLVGCSSDGQTQQAKLATAKWCVNLQHGASMCADNPTEKLKTAMRLCAQTTPYESVFAHRRDKLRACMAQKLAAK